jgi:hypothetical protein
MRTFIEWLNEFKLSGDDFGPEKSDLNVVRKAHKMQPVGSDFGGRLRNVSTEPTVVPATEEASIPLKLSYAVYNVFQRYWDGQRDPLYALLSRRGDSVDWVTVFATPVEVERLEAVTREVMNSDDPAEVHTAKSLKQVLDSI